MGKNDKPRPVSQKKSCFSRAGVVFFAVSGFSLAVKKSSRLCFVKKDVKRKMQQM